MDKLTILQGINLFKKDFLFTKETRSTRRLYVRSLDLFALFLVLDDLKAPGKETDLVMSTNVEKLLLQAAGVAEIKIRTAVTDEDKDIFSGIKTEDLNRTLLHDLDASVYPKFLAWLNSANRKNGKGLSQVTIKTYQAGIRAVLGFWRVRKQLSFMSEEQDDLLKHSSVSSKKIVNDPARKSKLVPKDFGEKMLAAAFEIPLPPVNKADRKNRIERLFSLRARALILVLYSSGQRISDVTNLTCEDLKEAQDGNLIIKQNIKTGRRAHFFLGAETIAGIEAYLRERDDTSPALFIQHGRWGTQPRGVEPAYFTREGYRKGYGAKLSTKTAREITKLVAEYAGYLKNGKPVGGVHVSPHAFRHYHLTKLKDMGLDLDIIQDIAGHASIETTKSIYASKVNQKMIIEVEKKMQDLIKIN